MKNHSKPFEIMRIQKHLAQLGYGSRRQIEKLIAEGDITVNGKIPPLGYQVQQQDKICIKGRPIEKQTVDTRLLMYHKPVGEICSHRDPEHTRTVYDHLPKLKVGKWITVGRLDLNSQGLLLITNSGDLAHQLMHPRHELERVYKVKIRGSLDDKAMRQMVKGIAIDEHVYSFENIKKLATQTTMDWYELTLTSGKNREIRKVFDYFGVQVVRLIRVQYGAYSLPKNLKPGELTEMALKN